MDRLSGMKRVMIVGQPGSGKSTLARMLGARTGLPVIHVDLIHWEPGWVERSLEEKQRLCRQAHAGDAWVFEGGVSSTWPERLDRCDTLIWLDLPLSLRVWRVARRTLRDYGRTRPDLPDNCPERFDLDFYRCIWRTRKSVRQRLKVLFETAPAEKHRVKLSSRSETERWLHSVTPEKAGGL